MTRPYIGVSPPYMGNLKLESQDQISMPWAERVQSRRHPR